MPSTIFIAWKASVKKAEHLLVYHQVILSLPLFYVDYVWNIQNIYTNYSVLVTLKFTSQ